MMHWCERVDQSLQRSTFLFTLLWGISLIIAALAQPAWYWWAGPIAAAVAYAVVFRLSLLFDRPRGRFLCGFFWFCGVQGFQWSWFASEFYQGKYIYIAYSLVVLAWALQFGLLTLCLGSWNRKSWVFPIVGAAFWTLMEWVRLYVLTGSTFNHVGMALACTQASLQAAALFGMYGLCFWVIWVNLLAVRCWERRGRLRDVAFFLIMALLPYLWGWAHLSYHREHLDSSPKIRVALVQTGQPPIEGLEPEVRANLFQYALDRWQKICEDLAAHQDEKIDLIVMPESTVPYGTDYPAYFHQDVSLIFDTFFGEKGKLALPPLEAPHAQQLPYGEERLWVVSNAYWLEALANLFSTEVVAGLQHKQAGADGGAEFFNSALRVQPGGKICRYDKRVLLPIAEYIPFSWLRPLAAQYGIHDSFTRGTDTPLFGEDVPLYGISICYEETFSELTRELRTKGARMLVNVTNDVWYPRTRLPRQHCEHGRLRTVENGVPLIRSCNTGVTAAIDSLGATLDQFGDEKGPFEWSSGVLAVDVPTYEYSTLYSRVGDGPIISLCFVLLLLGCVRSARD